MAHVVAGFHAANPLTDEELASVFDLALLRLATSVAISSERAAAEGGASEYHLVSQAPAWCALELLGDVHPHLATAVFRAAAGLMPIARTAASIPRVQGLGLPYQVVDPLTVAAGSTLTVEAGIVVKIGPSTSPVRRYIRVEGVLDLRGTPSDKVVFTSWRDDEYGGDSNGDGESSGARGDWYYLNLRDSRSTLHNAVLR